MTNATKAAGQPFAYFSYNEGWEMWEQVSDEHKGDPDVVAAFRAPIPAETPDQGEALRTARESLRAFLHMTKPTAEDLEDGRSDILQGLPDSHTFELTWAPEEPGNYITAGQIKRARAALASLDAATPAPDERRSVTDGDQAARTLARDAARWRALVTTFGPEDDVSSPHRPHTMLIAIDTEGCEVREDGRLNFKETLERALDDEIRLRSRLITPPAPPKPPAVKET